MNEKIELVEISPGNWCPKSMTEAPVGNSDWLGGWMDVKTHHPPIRSWVSGRGRSGKHYVLAVDAKGRMSIGFATERSSVPFTWAFAKPIGEPTHWRHLPKPPNAKLSDLRDENKT